MEQAALFWRYEWIAMALGAGLDLIFGDPHGLWHPVQGIGSMIALFEKLYRKIFPKTKKGELLAGIILAASVLLATAVISAALILFLYRIHPMFGLCIETYYCYSILAARSLSQESMKVYQALKKEGLEAGRNAVSWIVGRDTQNLDEDGVVRAAVETVAENTSDGVIAPMFYMAIFGTVGGWIYKAANTMDSMVGYKNEKYLYFGRAAAKLDDYLNFLPSRLSAVFLLFASSFLGMDTANAYRIWKRDRFCHASPNSAQTEAVMAGALDVQLAGDAYYFGQLVKKPTIGDSVRDIVPEDIGKANRMMFVAAAAGFIVCAGIRLLTWTIWLWFIRCQNGMLFR